jgi:hypothetical protein
MKGKDTDGSDLRMGCRAVLGQGSGIISTDDLGRVTASRGRIWGASGLYKDFVVIFSLSGIRCTAFFSSFACLRR